MHFYKHTAYRADFTFCLETISKQKTQGCARLTRKSYTMPAKIPETRRTSSNISNFFNAVTACFPAHRSRPSFDVAFHLHKRDICGTASFGLCQELKRNLSESRKLREIEEITRPNLGFMKTKGEDQKQP
ncbi:hypothetical protein [Draconibacterium orientale]|uniref:hypothetical protein n=1 Tax=Draconibacterium orientale TaxID=1168034 RepID=UPI002ABD6D5D|nr:hypothetical protein [Draconibacterium orientale]